LAEKQEGDIKRGATSSTLGNKVDEVIGFPGEKNPLLNSQGGAHVKDVGKREVGKTGLL